MGGGVDTKRTFDTLNGMRGIAALAVVMMHAQWWLGVIHPAIVSLAVDLFFVLSGFVIAYAYQQPLSAGLRRRDFMLARFIRLYPMFVIGLAFGIAAAWTYARPSNLTPFFDNVGFNLFMLPFPLQYPGKVDNLFPLDFPAWSLFYELIAYVIFALLTPRLNNRRLAVLIAIGFLMLIVTGATEGSLDRGTWRPSVLGGFARVTFSFFAGVALYRLWLRHPTRIRLHPAILFVLLILPLTWRPDAGPFAWLYELAVITLWMPLMVWLGAGSTAKGFWLRMCVVLGALSYPLYIVHAPILSVVGQFDNYQVAAFLSQTAPWGALGLIFLLGGFAWLLATYVDAPVRRWLTSILMPNWSKARAPGPDSTALAGDR